MTYRDTLKRLNIVFSTGKGKEVATSRHEVYVQIWLKFFYSRVTRQQLSHKNTEMKVKLIIIQDLFSCSLLIKQDY